MIIDLQKFITEEKKYWSELEETLNKLERDSLHKMNVEQVKRFHYLYQRTSADLAKVMPFSSETNIRRYLESLIARSYSEVHEIRKKTHRLAPLHWFFRTFPRTFRRHIYAFWVSIAATLLGVVFGGFAISFDPDAKEILMPFSHLRGDPSERVAREEEIAKDASNDRLRGAKTSFSAYLMTHNTRVSIFTFAMGITWGIGTIILLFYNGVILGAVSLDYILAGETKFLVGWLLPHGTIEIPAIILAGQTGFVLAGALIGWGQRLSLRKRLQQIFGDLVTLIFGVAIMLIWAGFVEAFLSQYHEPIIPYSVKIGFGVVELIALTAFLWFSGRSPQRQEE
jgi:uncharacterized membrane protein SpoIIM required for sporulation